MQNTPLLIACSPRKGGNTDSIVQAWSDNVEQAVPWRCLFLRDYHILGCIDCGACRTGTLKATSFAAFAAKAFSCPLARKDDSQKLFVQILQAPALAFISPIYFFHVPALAKALVDRTQPFWHLSSLRPDLLQDLPSRPCYRVLIAGRPRGEQLFASTLLALQYAFSPMGYLMQQPLLLPGLDQPKDFTANKEAQAQLQQYLQEIVHHTPCKK